MAEKRSTRGEAVRQAVDEAFQAAAGQAQVPRERAQDVVDELAGAAGRLRDVLEDLRPPSTDEIRDLRAEVRSLADRVARLEQGQAPTPKPKPKRAPRTRASTKKT